MRPTSDTERKFRELIAIVDKLRSPEGCPWDRVQRKEDIGRYLIEEAYEVIDALEEESPENLGEELGDLLFHILFLARLAEEAHEFSMADILDRITAKMIRRHPHVFGNATVKNVEEVHTNWERIKTEVERKPPRTSPLFGGIPRFLSTLAKAQCVTTRAAEVGFDWSDVEGVLRKVEEELAEFRVALKTNQPPRLKDEAGDLLFTLVNLCRFVRVDAEAALRSSLQKFTDRFSDIERELAAQGKTPRNSSPAEMNRIWDKTKRMKGNSNNS
ncbi:MAG: nucleoside triphosphate pyrophosphohydrolase [Syntrophales bacterium]|nr:nucleoside triphosphate pyrophosphohydrolase [Syntrophales bacterium]